MIFTHIIVTPTQSIYFSMIRRTNKNIAEVAKTTDFNKLVSQMDAFMLFNNLKTYPAISKNSFRTANQLLLF